MKKVILLGIFLSFSLPAEAYIPQFSTILEKTALNHGKGLYVLELDINLQPPTGSAITLREEWLVENSRKMLLKVRSFFKNGESSEQVFLYQNHRKIFRDSQGRIQRNKLPTKWFEFFFHFRLPKNLHPFLLGFKIAPSKIFKPLEVVGLKNLSRSPQEGVHLSRFKGQVAYRISRSLSSQKHNSLWISQDTFRVIRLQLAQADIQADKYKRYPLGLWFPRQRTLTWKNYKATLKLVSVKRGPWKDRKKFQISQLPKTPLEVRDLNSEKIVNEFYRDFR